MHGQLAALDWAVIGLYLAGMIGLSAWLSLRQKSKRDYYLGGNSTGPLPIALSTMATQCSTNSLLGAPAFVAFTVGGGLVWLQFELALPLAMILLMAVVIPTLRGLNLISVYEYLERRFGVVSRLCVSILFQFLRAFSTGVTVWGVSLVIHICTGLDLVATVLILGITTIVYDVLGGMKAVILSDVIQLILLFGTILLCLTIGWDLVGGWNGIQGAVDPDRIRAIDFSAHGLGDGQTYAFWPMLIGGFFLYVSYYGVDQTQAQRSLATRNVREARQALFLGGLLRFPLVLAYCLLGIVIAAYAAQNPAFIESLPLRSEVGGQGDDPDYNTAVPIFVLQHFPVGLVGLVMVGLFAAAMSSLDSTLNSLSAVTMQDIVHRFWGDRLENRPKIELLISKAITLFWGSLCLVFSFFVSDISPSIVEAINKIGSVLNGPLLGIFLLGLLFKSTNQLGALAGFFGGISLNILLWIFFEQEISWLWWNVMGLAMCLALGFLISQTGKARAISGNAMVETDKATKGPYLILAAFSAIILIILLFFNWLAAN